jgi:pseudouridine-5'-phosphate glycosidase
MNPHLDIAPEVRDALAAGRPVVALESTVIAHGMAYPKNLETALAVEAVVRAGGAVPATAAVIGGRLKAGLTEAEIGRVAKAGDIMKATARDLGYLAATGGDGATTVAATMRIAALAGIPVFATGGIGGVHRGAAESFDISADLQEMTASRVAVVAAGAKSILDIGATLERLESLGVPVAVYGSDRFPAFYARDSGFAAPLRLDDSPAIARLMRAHWALGGGGLLIANPIPAEDEIPAAVIDKAIAAALAEMAERRIGGKAATPFLLARVAEISGGASLKANIALIKNNARLAAAVAVAFAAPGKG